MKAFVLGSTAALASLAGFAVQAQDTGQGTATVSVTEAPVLIGDSSDGIVFSPVVSGGSDQTQTVPPSSGSSATFVLSGQAGQTYSISLPTTATLTDGSGSNTLIINTFTSDFDGTPLTAATQNLQVGASLTVPANSIGGFYSGTFLVTVNNP